MIARLVALTAGFAGLVACDEGASLCDTPPRDVIGTHIVAASEGTFTLEPGEALTRQLSADMRVSRVQVSARYTLVEPQDNTVVIDQVDCLTGTTIAPLDAGPRILQFPEVGCQGDCTVRLCIRAESTADVAVLVDDAITILYEQELSCGEVGRTEGQAPLYALDVSVVD